MFFFQYFTTWAGGVASHSDITFTPSGDVSADTLSYEALAFTLRLPELTLAPGDSLYLGASILARVADFDSGTGNALTTRSRAPALCKLAQNSDS